MSPSANITKRTRKDGPRYVVRYRLGGRYAQQIHGGSFRHRKDAVARRDLIVSEIAAGRDPRILLQRLATQGTTRLTLHAAFDAFIASRVDTSEGTRRNYQFPRNRW